MFIASSNYLTLLIYMSVFTIKADDFCSVGDDTCASDVHIKKYSAETNDNTLVRLTMIEELNKNYKSCSFSNCSCFLKVIHKDLKPFETGIDESMLNSVQNKGVKYQIINHRLYRSPDCMFPSRCSGIEYFIKQHLAKLPDMEFIINVRDWPQIDKRYSLPKPVFSFSKTSNYFDIMYPTWSFWDGGPAIKLYPRGLGRWDLHRKSLQAAADQWPWDLKLNKAFFRGSRTSSERDNLILLSRELPELIDAAYTKNQAWKSSSDTLHADPAEEVSLEDHCRYKFLFNYRGVAASFRFRHLFLCKSLVFHVGSEWVEFFYPNLEPWVHYIPVDSRSSKEELKEIISFMLNNSDVAKRIANNGYNFIREHLKLKDVACYWESLLTSYGKLLTFQPVLDKKLIQVD